MIATSTRASVNSACSTSVERAWHDVGTSAYDASICANQMSGLPMTPAHCRSCAVRLSKAVSVRMSAEVRADEHEEVNQDTDTTTQNQ